MPNNTPLGHEQFWALPHHSAAEILRAFHPQCEHSTPPHRAGHPTPEAAVLSPAAASTTTPKPYTVQKGVAIISISGAITRKSSWYSSWFGQTGQDNIRTALDAALADKSVKAILLDINSPGGVVSGTKELADYIAIARKTKPCAAYANGLCASAALWLASATGRIFAPQTAQVGSVGVLYVHADWSKYNEKSGIAYTYITGGTFKAVGNEHSPLSESDKAYLQQHITALHDIFATDVAKHLRITAQRGAWAEGQTFLATEAKSLGLVKSIVADLSAAVQKLAEENMTKAELAQQYPELLAELQAEALVQAKAELAATTVASPPQQDTLALVKAVLGEEASAKVQAVADAGVSAQQFAALAPLLHSTAPVQTSNTEAANIPNAADLSAQILAGITQAHGEPVKGIAPHTTPKSSLVADAEKRSCKE